MSESNAELIAASETWTPAEVHASPVGAARIIESLADALEATERERDNWKLSAEEVERAEKRWKDRAVEAERELQVAEDQANNLAGDLAQAERERDQYAAVVEKARAVIECESGWFRYRAGRVLDILATSPRIKNPYRAQEEER